MINSQDLDGFFEVMGSIFDKFSAYKEIKEDLVNFKPNSWDLFRQFIQDLFFKEYQSQTWENIPRFAISQIFYMLIRKEYEISTSISQAVRIEMEKSRILV